MSNDDGSPPLYEDHDDEDDGPPPLIYVGFTRPTVIVDPDLPSQYLFLWAMQKAECMLPPELMLMVLANITQADKYKCCLCKKKDFVNFFKVIGRFAYCSEFCMY